MKTIEKILYYKDAGLLWKVFIISLKISFIFYTKKQQSTLALISSGGMNKIKNADKDKITRYVNLFLFIRKKLGIRDACLYRSLFLWHVLKQAGIKVKLNFGAGKRENKLTGHCWLSFEEDVNPGFQVIQTYH